MPQRLVREVLEVMHNEGKMKKRGEYTKYNPTIQAQIGKEACEIGVAAAVGKLNKQLDIAKPLNESTTRSIKKAYLSEVRTELRNLL